MVAQCRPGSALRHRLSRQVSIADVFKYTGPDGRDLRDDWAVAFDTSSLAVLATVPVSGGVRANPRAALMLCIAALGIRLLIMVYVQL